jgi:hypothetical protein
VLQTFWLSLLSKTGVPIERRKTPVPSGLAVLRHPVHNHPILELKGGKGAWANTAKKDVRASRNRWFRQVCGYPPPVRRGHISLQDGKLQKLAILQDKTEEKKQRRCIFPNDFDKKLTESG